MDFVSKSVKRTKYFARKFAANILNNGLRDSDRMRKQAVILALEGELGSGKTTFAQGFLGYFGVKKANSPTFVIMKKYIYKSQISNLKSKIWNKLQIICLYHIDCYRIRSSRDLLELGFKEIAGDSRNVILIEWAERIKDILPQSAVHIKFEHESENKRKIVISNFNL